MVSPAGSILHATANDWSPTMTAPLPTPTQPIEQLLARDLAAWQLARAAIAKAKAASTSVR